MKQRNFGITQAKFKITALQFRGRSSVSQKQTVMNMKVRVTRKIWISILKEKIIFVFFLIIWKQFLSNTNSNFKHSVLDKNIFNCKMYPFPLPPQHLHKHTFYFINIISLLQKQKLLSNLSVYPSLMNFQLDGTPQNKPLVCCLPIY